MNTPVPGLGLALGTGTQPLSWGSSVSRAGGSSTQLPSLPELPVTMVLQGPGAGQWRVGEEGRPLVGLRSTNSHQKKTGRKEREREKSFVGLR